MPSKGSVNASWCCGGNRKPAVVGDLRSVGVSTILRYFQIFGSSQRIDTALSINATLNPTHAPTITSLG